MKWSNIEEWFLSKSNVSQLHRLALFFNTLYCASHSISELNESNIFCLIFYGKIWQWSDVLHNFSSFFSSKQILKMFSIHESSAVGFKCRYKRNSNLIYAVVICDYFLISEWYLVVEQWCSKWDSMYEIEKEMCALCVVWAKVRLLLEIDVIMCLYGQKFWECVCKQGKANTGRVKRNGKKKKAEEKNDAHQFVRKLRTWKSNFYCKHTNRKESRRDNEMDTFVESCNSR